MANRLKPGRSASGADLLAVPECLVAGVSDRELYATRRRASAELRAERIADAELDLTGWWRLGPRGRSRPPLAQAMDAQ